MKGKKKVRPVAGFEPAATAIHCSLTKQARRRYHTSRPNGLICFAKIAPTQGGGSPASRLRNKLVYLPGRTPHASEIGC